MSSLVSMVRFLAGLALLTTGVAVAAPYLLDLVAAWQRPVNGSDWARAVPAVATADQTVPAANAFAAVVPAPPQMPTQMPISSEGPEQSAAASPELAEVSPDSQGLAVAMLDRDFRPPPPPARMPEIGPAMGQSTPALAAAYRSTVDVPPPPLLDADTPPPLAVGWSANDAANQARQRPAPSQAVGATYVVRDGDDLTGIATRLFGHPAAASAIWSLNRDRLTNPDLLPIGMTLRMPPAAAAYVGRADGGQANLIQPSSRPGRVRVGPGETLETLARRFYGDPAMASRLWEANRDQLRNPALLVAGMELRLP